MFFSSLFPFVYTNLCISKVHFHLKLYNYDIGDNDDISGYPTEVFETMRTLSYTDISVFHSSFIDQLNSDEVISANTINNFMFLNLYSIPSYEMKTSQVTNFNKQIVNNGQVEFTWVPQNYAGIQNYNSGSIVNSGIFFKNIDQTYAGQIDFATRSLVGEYGVRMSINKDGNVGIGTTGPGAKLEVSGSSATDHNIRIRDTRSNVAVPILMGALEFSSDDGDFGTSNTVTSQIAAIQENPNGWGSTVGLGFFTSKAVGGTTNLNAEKMRITGDGNVGIGTTGPNAKLEVAGTFNATSNGGTLQVDSSGNVNIGL